MRAPSIGAIRLLRMISSSTARSSARSVSPWAGSLTSCSRPKRSIVSAMSTSSACGTANLLKFINASTTCSASWPAARAFHSASGVIR